MTGRLWPIAAAAIWAAFSAALAAQDFGFGDGEAKGVGGARVGGELEVGYVFPLEDMDAAGDLALGRLVSGRLSLDAAGDRAEASMRLRLGESAFADMAAGEWWACVDEARLRLFAGPVTLEGGLMKLSWGKADSSGPLDVTNPRDLRDLSAGDEPLESKIAMPMLRASFGIGERTKVEALFEPWFMGDRYATSGAWRPSALDSIDASIGQVAAVMALYLGDASLSGATYADLLPDYSSLEHFQAGLRATTTLGAVDVGAQYFYGYLTTPAVSVSRALAALSAMSCSTWGTTFSTTTSATMASPLAAQYRDAG